jgi:hypothetical protein
MNRLHDFAEEQFQISDSDAAAVSTWLAPTTARAIINQACKGESVTGARCRLENLADTLIRIARDAPRIPSA